MRAGSNPAKGPLATGQVLTIHVCLSLQLNRIEHGTDRSWTVYDLPAPRKMHGDR